MSRELLQQALDALEYHTMQTRPIKHTDKAIEAIKAELAKQEFYPDWDMLKPFYERIAELEAQPAQPEQEPCKCIDQFWCATFDRCKRNE